DSKKWLGTQWRGTYKERLEIEDEFKVAAGWAKRVGLPMMLGEYGAYSTADMESRIRWTKAMTGLALKHNFSYFYWEFKAGYGLYDDETKTWNEALTAAVTAAE